MSRVDAATLVELFFRRVADTPQGTALFVPEEGKWRPVTWAELADRAYRTTVVLQGRGVRAGDRVVQLSENRLEWIVADLAILFARAVHVPIHATLAAPQVLEQVADCGARLVIVSNGQQASKLAGSELLANLEIWSHEACCRTDCNPSYAVGNLTEAVRRVAAAPPTVAWEAVNHTAPEDLASIIYTSGTTGEPKGVMLTHANLTTNTLGTLAEFEFSECDVRLGFLPLSHIFARTCDYYCGMACGSALAIARGRDTVLEDCLAVHPTAIDGVPYFFEKVMRLAQEQRKNVRDLLGGRVWLCCSGGAALPDHVAAYYAAEGVPLVQGYGLTETSPVITISTPTMHKIGTVGRPIRDVEIRIAADGEVLSRGPHIMAGYWQRPEATAEVLREGWFHTGDLGEIDDDGFLRITGRKKELIVTAAGKNVAPVRLEALLAEDPLVQQAMVIGDGRSYLVALIVPNREAVERALGIADTSISALLSERIDARLACVSHHEQVRRFALIERPFSIESGELTPTLKLRRETIARHYAATIESLYTECNAVGQVKRPRDQPSAEISPAPA